MYLIPRLIGVGVYTAVLFIMALMIWYAASKKFIRGTLNVYWVIVGLMGYFFVPPSGFDLPRLIERMQYYVELPKETFAERFFNSLTPGEQVYYKIIGFFPNADRLLPCISALISFGFCFAILKDLLKNKEDRAAISVALMLFMARGGMMMAIDTIRSYMAMAIIAWCVYQELCKKKSFVKHLPLYIIACSMHAMGYVLLLIRVLYMLLGFQKSFAKKTVTRVFTMVMIGVSVVALPNIWTKLFEKMEYYYEAGQAGESYFYLWEGILSVMTVLVAVYLLWYISKRCRVPECGMEPPEVDYCSYMKLLILIIVVSIFIEYNFFMRMGHYAMILIMPLAVFALRLARQQNDTRLKQNLICISMAMLLLACARGYLCSLKFFE